MLNFFLIIIIFQIRNSEENAIQDKTTDGMYRIQSQKQFILNI